MIMYDLVYSIHMYDYSYYEDRRIWIHAYGNMHMETCIWKHAYGNMHMETCIWTHAYAYNEP